MPTAHLVDRALISLSGPDAGQFLQNILTTDLDALAPHEARTGALLTPQGKILFDFLVSRPGENAYLLDCRADIVADFVRRLTLYKLRAKVEISKQDLAVVAVTWGALSSSSQNESTAFRDMRFRASGAVFRSCENLPPADAGVAAWHAFRITEGIAESGTDYALGDAFPHDVLIDELGGVGFRKGCYVGQEVVSRMQHRGTARRRVLLISSDTDLPSPGTEISAAGRALGALGSVAGKNGLAILRVDRVKDALDAGAPITAGGTPVSVAIPSWAKFTYYPAPVAAGSEA